MKLYLDDIREAPAGWTRCYTATECITILKTQDVDELSLDHDLGLINETGYDVLCWIELEVAHNNYCPPLIYVHSANSSARVKMNLAISSINQLWLTLG